MPFIGTICGDVGTGKTSLAATFRDAFLIRTTGEGVPTDIADPPLTLGETDTSVKLFDQLKALAWDDHKFRTLILDSVSGLERMFIQEILDKEPGKGMNKAAGGYGNARDIVAAQHMQVRKMAERLRERGMNIVFISHVNIVRVDPPEIDGFNKYVLSMHDKSSPSYLADVDVVGFLRQATILRDVNGVKKAISTGERVLNTHASPSSPAKNRVGLPEEIEVIKGVNPFAQFMAKPKRRKPEPAPTDDGGDAHEPINEGDEA